MRSDSPYGSIHDEIPLKFRGIFKKNHKNDRDLDIEEPEVNTSDKPELVEISEIFDLSLFPHSLDNLTDIKIRGGYYREDPLTGCLYLKKSDNPYYVGKLNGCHITRF